MRTLTKLILKEATSSPTATSSTTSTTASAITAAATTTTTRGAREDTLDELPSFSSAASSNQQQPKQWINTLSFLASNILGMGKGGNDTARQVQPTEPPPQQQYEGDGVEDCGDENGATPPPSVSATDVSSAASPQPSAGLVSRSRPLPMLSSTAEASSKYSSTGSSGPPPLSSSPSLPSSAVLLAGAIPKAPIGAGGHVLYPEFPHPPKVHNALRRIFGGSSSSGASATASSASIATSSSSSIADDRILPSLMYNVNWNLMQLKPHSNTAQHQHYLQSGGGGVQPSKRGGMATERAADHAVGEAGPDNSNKGTTDNDEASVKGCCCSSSVLEGGGEEREAIVSPLTDAPLPAAASSSSLAHRQNNGTMNTKQNVLDTRRKLSLPPQLQEGDGDEKNTSTSPPVITEYLFERYVPSQFDAETQQWLKSKAIPSVIRGAASAWMQVGMSRTSANAIAGRGEMFVLSREQLVNLLKKYDEREGGAGGAGKGSALFYNNLRIPTLIDIGAGDGGATAAYGSKLFNTIAVTEDNKAMQWRLWWRGFRVVDFPSCVFDDRVFRTLIQPSSSSSSLSSYPASASLTTVFALMNVLDRADTPSSLLKAIVKAMEKIDEAANGDDGETSASPSSLFLMAVVLPWCPFVETKTMKMPPSEPLPMDGGKCVERAYFETSLATLVANVILPHGLEVVAWTRVPYLCEGSATHGYYRLDDAVLLMRRRKHAKNTPE